MQLYVVVEAHPLLATFAAPSVPIGGAGHVLPVAWNGVAGATGVEVTQALLTIAPSVAEEVHSGVNVQPDGGGWSISVPSGRRVRAIGLRHLRRNGARVRSIPAGLRLTVAFPPVSGSGFDTPRFAVPAVDRNHAVPPTLTGATFSDSVLQLTPAVAASRARVALVSGGNPTSFVDEPAELDSVQLTTHTAARNARVEGPDGTVLWQMPEFDPAAPPAEVDLRQALAAAFQSQLASGGPLSAAIRLRADAPAEARPSFSGASGFLVRREERVVRTMLEGEPRPLAVGPLPSEVPTTVTGDLTIRYEGIRLLESVSDPLPAASAPVSGSIVGQDGIVRACPPRAFEARPPARIGVFGRSPGGCELVVEVVELPGGVPGAVIGRPAVAEVRDDGVLRTRWVSLGADIAGTGPIGIRVRANGGRFFWVQTEGGAPTLRVAVHDPDPGGRPLRLGDVVVAHVSGSAVHVPDHVFPAAVFSGTDPAFDSDLFVTVDCSDLVLRYAR